jgi:hypothetical protein
LYEIKLERTQIPDLDGQHQRVRPFSPNIQMQQKDIRQRRKERMKHRDLLKRRVFVASRPAQGKRSKAAICVD